MLNFWVHKIAYQTRKCLSKRHYQTGIWLSTISTGREFGSQISLPDENRALSSSNDIWETNAHLVMPFWETFSRLVSNFESPKIWQKCIFLFFIESFKISHLWPLNKSVGERAFFIANKTLLCTVPLNKWIMYRSVMYPNIKCYRGLSNNLSRMTCSTISAISLSLQTYG